MLYIDFTDLEKRKPHFTRPEILTQPGIPQQMHGTNPRTINGTAWWDETRKEAYAKNNYCCFACGTATGRLEAHEVYSYERKKRKLRHVVIVRLVEVVALCTVCHAFIHRLRLRNITRKGESSSEYYSYVVAHGYDILVTNKLKVQTVSPLILTVPASRWILKIGRKEYPMRFTTEKEREKYYGG